MPYTVQSIKKVETRKKGEKELWYISKLKDEKSGETINLKLDKEPKFQPGEKIEVEQKTNQLKLSN